MTTLKVNAFYKFVEIEDLPSFRQVLYDAGHTRKITGSILLAPEGINGTVCGPAGNLSAFFEWLKLDVRFADLEIKHSPSPGHPFKRFKVKIKPEIVTFGVPLSERPATTGVYVEPEDWNTLLADPNLVLIDTRNAYEVKIGTFASAIDPNTTAFNQFPAFVSARLDPKAHPKVAMFCTGGIRCEKASAYLLSQGFSDVFQLRGGILSYLETVGEDESLWRGECFVFDERVALTHGLQLGTHVLCHCGYPVKKDDAPGWTPENRVVCVACVAKRDGDEVKSNTLSDAVGALPNAPTGSSIPS